MKAVGPQHETCILAALFLKKTCLYLSKILWLMFVFNTRINIDFPLFSCKICIVSHNLVHPVEDQIGLVLETTHACSSPWFCEDLSMCGTLLLRVILWSLPDYSHEHSYMHFKYVPDLGLKLSSKWPLRSSLRNGIHLECVCSLCGRHSE